MKIALIRRGNITHLDGVNRIIALLAEGLRKLGHEVEVFSWCYRGVDRERLEEWLKDIHGLDATIPIHTLRKEPCKGDPWVRIALEWFFKGSAMLRKGEFDVAIVNGVIPLRFRPKIAVNHGILHYYYVPLVLNKINRALKLGGALVLTTPNIASLFRRLRLLLGKQPIYRYHVREYTVKEVVSLLREAGFEVIKAYYSTVNDSTCIDADPEEYLGISGFKDLVGIALKKPTKTKHLKALSTPHSKARAKPKAINSSCCNKDSRTNGKGTGEMVMNELRCKAHNAGFGQGRKYNSNKSM
jgi:glycosyltransferase involved in cell wall biosynthesis